jgi:hypothetical protein
MAKQPTLNLDTPHAAADMLTACVAAARVDAQRFFSQRPPPAWRPRAGHQTRWWLLGALALATGGVAATVWHRQSSQVPPASAQPRPATHPALLWDLPGATAVPTPVSELPAPVPSATLMAAAPPNQEQEQPRLERLENGELRMQLVANDRYDAANRLAALTGARSLERPEALAQTRPVTLRWQGHDTAGAWRALLADEAHYLLDCRVERACKVWIFGAHGASPAGVQLAVPADRSLPASLPDMPADVGTTAAMAAAAPAPQPDAPGLFPSD